jgi:hypothetical protein
MKTDYLGNEVNVGDKVIFIEPNYKGFNKGIIIKLNEAQATIRIPEYKEEDWEYNKMGYGKTCRFYNCIIKVIG